MSLKERIIKESTRLFIQRGVKSVRMDDIATALGVSKRTIYELFGDRESLIIACVNDFYIAQNERHDHRARFVDNVIDEFILLLEDWEDVIAININFMKDLERFYPAIYEKVRSEALQRGRERLKSKLQHGINDGLFFKGLNVDFTTVALMASINTIFAFPSMYQEVNVSMADAFKYITMCFFRGISTEKGIRLIDTTLHKHFPEDLFGKSE